MTIRGGDERRKVIGARVLRRALFVGLILVGGVLMGHASIQASDGDASVEVLHHEWHPSTVWERIGKTKFVWNATVRNDSDRRKRVFVYYDLLDSDNFPLARNVANRIIEPHQTVDIGSDSYIESIKLPLIKSSRATVDVTRTLYR